MRIEVRLYHFHDLDLVSLYRIGAVRFSKATVMALNAFARKEYFRFAIGEPSKELRSRHVYRYFIVLKEGADDPAIELLSEIAQGYRNNFIKMILRQYLCAPIPDVYLQDITKRVYFEERFLELNKEKEMIPIVWRKKFSKKISKKGKDKRIPDHLRNSAGSFENKNKAPKAVQEQNNEKDVTKEQLPLPFASTTAKPDLFVKQPEIPNDGKKSEEITDDQGQENGLSLEEELAFTQLMQGIMEID